MGSCLGYDNQDADSDGLADDCYTVEGVNEYGDVGSASSDA